MQKINSKDKSGSVAKVGTLPGCDFCGCQATFDAKTTMGYWANMCLFHFAKYANGRALGVGKGQMLVLDKVSDN